MAVYKLFPSQDATMYSLFPQMNTGLDEIIEISNLNFALNSFPQVSRYLVQFDQDEIDNVIDGKIKGVQWDAHLRNYIATAQGINLDTRLYIYPVSGAWGMGTGKYLDSPIVTNGVSWQYQVQSGSAQWATSGFGAYVTASYSGSNAGGGTWYTGSSLPGLDIAQTQTFSYRSDKDLNVIVTDTVKAWYTSSKNLTGSYTNIVNNGFLVKWEGYNSYEDATGNYYVEFNQNKNTQPVLQYYSVDTYTSANTLSPT